MDKINKLQRQSSFSSNAQLLIETAREKQIPVLKLAPEYDLFQLGQGKYSVLFRGLVAENSASILSAFNDEGLIKRLLDDFNFYKPNKLADNDRENYKILIVNKQIKAALKISENSESDILIQLNEETKNLILKLSKLYNLNIAEIALSSVDITAPIITSGEITDININPTLNQYQEVVNLKAITQQLIDYYTPSRIPIISVIANNNQIVVNIIARILENIKLTPGIIINNVIYNYNFATAKNNEGVKTLLQDKEMEALLHGVTAKELQQSGLPYEHSNLLLITDIKKAEQLNLQQLNNRSFVLGIDKKCDLRMMRQWSKERIIYCSLNHDNLMLQQQLKSKHPAVFTTANNLVLFDGVDQLPVIALNRLIPVARSDANIMSGILFAVAAAFRLEIPIFVIRSVLENLSGNEIVDIVDTK